MAFYCKGRIKITNILKKVMKKIKGPKKDNIYIKWKMYFVIFQQQSGNLSQGDYV